MPKFRVKVEATAEIEEIWLVNAKSEEEARRIVDDGELGDRGAQFVSDRVVDNERDRVCLSVEKL